MVEGLLHPLNIFIIGLGGGFLIPLLYKVSKGLPAIAFWVSLLGIATISGACLWRIHGGAEPIEILTAGSTPPLAISLRFGSWEGFFAFFVNVAAVLGAWHLWARLRDSYAVLLLYLILIMGINGMIMTRDLFNLFVFLEIVSIATYGLLGLERTPAALAAAFKYIMATVLASSFFLLGSALLYHVTGTLNIDEMIARRDLIAGPIGATALLLVLGCLIIELKPFPANGWGLDVYETAPAGIAALVSVGVSAGVFFALLKLLPLFEPHLTLIALSAGLTFIMSNLVGLRQTNVQRMLGCSSIAQMALVMIALTQLTQLGANDSMPLVIGGLFFNHLFAKAGLFWLAGIVRRERLHDWNAISDRPMILAVLAALVVAIAGLPPFPGFWAKWELVVQLAAGGRYFVIAIVLIGSLLEAAYMFRWFSEATRPAPTAPRLAAPLAQLILPGACVALLAAGGIHAASLSGAASLLLFAPLAVGTLLLAAEALPGRLKCALMLVVVPLAGLWLGQGIGGINQLFAVLLFAGGVVIAFAGFYRPDPRHGYYPLMAVLLLSIVSLFRAGTSLEFFYAWEMVTLSSCLLIAMAPAARNAALTYLLFSLASAFVSLAGFALAAAANATTDLSAYFASGHDAVPAFVLLAIGFLIKIGAIGVHVWLPPAYAKADDDFSAMLSAVVSKAAIFGLFMTTYLAVRSEFGLEFAHVIGWIGMLTTVVAALLALQQADMKRLLAYSSISQTGYIVTAIALMSHLGWVTALYLVANHLMVKGILFLAVAGVIHRTGQHRLEQSGGLAGRMPLTFAASVVALVAMSGLPPLAGFGGKWLLLSAMMDKGWYGPVVLGALATLIGLLYMFRLGYTVFLGSSKLQLTSVQEAPAALLLPQFILIAGILLLSFFPKLIMDPISAAIDPQFASTLVWQGMSLELIYGYWNPVPTMIAAVAISAIGFALLWIVYRNSGWPSASDGIARFYRYFRAKLAPLLLPYAYRFWDGAAGLAEQAGGAARRVYGGDGQIYALYVLYYVAALYLLAFVAGR